MQREARRPEGRRRKAGAGIVGQRLGVNESKLDFDRYTYRWINDAPARIHAKTKEDDWDVVMNDGSVKEDNADLGNAVRQIVGTQPTGAPLYAYLCRKPKSYFDEDQKAKMAELDRQLTELRKGHAPDGARQVDETDYVPTSGIRL